MTRHRKTRSYTASDEEHDSMLKRIGTKGVDGEPIRNLSRLIVHAVKKLPPHRHGK